ncbi:hspbap1, partial [Symbiodinium natans]
EAEPEEEQYWRPTPGAVPPFDAPRIREPTRKQFEQLILDGKIFVVPDISADWELRRWDCDFFQTDPEFKKAAMNHQYTAGGGRDMKLGDDWQGDQTASGAKNDTAPQIAPFYWGIKDVQFERRPGWTKAMLRRVAKSFKVPKFMHPKHTARDFGSTPEFWFGTGQAGAKAHMDSHVQATVSVQISGRKRWRLMPLRQRAAPFLAMIYSDGQPYENDEGWKPLFEITLEPGEGLFFPPGMVHETMNVGDVCASSVTFQFNYPYAARFYRHDLTAELRFFPRVRYTADIGESWVLIKDWARLGLPGDERGKGEPFDSARKRADLAPHFAKLDQDSNGQLTESELGFLDSHAVNAIAWHDTDGDHAISLEEYRDGFAYWSSVTSAAIKATPKEWRKFQLIGTVENLEDVPDALSRKMREASLREEARLRSAKEQRSDL